GSSSSPPTCFTAPALRIRRNPDHAAPGTPLAFAPRSDRGRAGFPAGRTAMTRGLAATLAWVFFASTVFLAVSCQRAPESIAEGEICHRCRRVITEDRLAGEILTPDV